MKHLGPFVTLFAVVLSAWIPVGCSQQSDTGVTSKDVRKEAKEALETTAAYTQQQMEEFQKQVQAELAKYDERIDELQAKAAMLKEEVKAKFDEQIKNLREKRQVVQSKLEQLQASSGKAWEDLKTGMDAAMEDLEKSYQDAVSHFS